MIPTDRPDLLDAALASLRQFAIRSGARGRFIAVYLGLRRMGEKVAPLGSQSFTPVGDIEAYLDLMWTKVHRLDARSVLTAPFGGSAGDNKGYSTRTGVVPPGLKYPANNWRNNLNIQKGIGCAAEPELIPKILSNPERRMSCPHMTYSDDAGHVCGITGTSYRGEEHSIWLAYHAPLGYQVVDLDAPEVSRQYIQPSGQRIPIYPLMAVLYAFAPDGFYPKRRLISLHDFAVDFGYKLEAVAEEFECDPEHPVNRAMLSLAEMRPDKVGEVPQPAEIRPGASEEAGMKFTFGSPLPELASPLLLNNGLGAELEVAHELREQGWEVHYAGNQNLVGYDIYAERNEESIRVEVKSSTGYATPELTESEWRAAMQYEDAFVVAVVDHFGSPQQTIWYVRNISGHVTPSVRLSSVYRLPRRDIEDLRTEVDFL